jgi:hypothetical protein
MQSILIEQAITLLLLTGWCITTTGVGRLCLSITAINFASRCEGLFLSFGIGLVVIGYAVFILGVTQALTAGAITLLILSLCALAAAGWLRKLSARPAIPHARLAWDRLASFFLGITIAAGFFLVLTPESGKDALIYHLAVPKLYLANQGFTFIPGNIFAGYPLLGEMHYVLALFLRNDILAKEIHYAILCGTLVGIGLFTRILMREHALPALSMLLFFSIPSVFMISHTAYNDLFVTLFALAAVYTFLRWSDDGTWGWIILCGIFSGSAAACKYTALLLTPLGCLGILWSNTRGKKSALQAFQQIAVYTCLAFIAGCPFYIKNWILLGNPFYPFFYDLFGGLGWDSDQARMYDLFVRTLGMGRGWMDYLLLPWNLSFRARIDSPQFDGILGPIFFLTLPFLIGKRHWETPVRVLIVYTLTTFLFWASSAQQIRYLIPLFALLAIVSGAILTRYQSQKFVFGLLALIVMGSLAFNGLFITRHFMKVRPFDSAVGLESRDEFLTRMIPGYSMYQFANRELPNGSRIFLIYMKNFTFLCTHSCYSDAMFETHTLQEILRASTSPADVHDHLIRNGFTHLLYDEFYVLAEPSTLSPEEKRLFISFRDSQCALVKQMGPYRLESLH